MGFALAFMTGLFFAINNVLVFKGQKISKNDNGIYMSMFSGVIVIGVGLIVYRLMSANPAPSNVKGILLFAAAGFFTMLLGRSMLFAGIRRIGSSRAAAIKNSAPIFTLVFAITVLHEKIGFWPWIGILFIFGGLFLQGYRLFREQGDGRNGAGLLFSLFAALGFGIGQGGRKLAMGEFADPFAGAFIGSLLALIGLSLIEVWKGQFVQSFKQNIFSSNRYYIWGGISSSFAVLSFFSALLFTKVAYVGAIAASEPVLTVLFSWLFLKRAEVLTPAIIYSALVIFFGACLISFTG
jgi:DME family drug/metabolite transporter